MCVRERECVCTHNCSNFAVLVYMPMPLVTCFFLFRCLRVSRKGGPAANSTPPILVGDLLLKVDGKPVDKIHSARDALALLQVLSCKCSQALVCVDICVYCIYVYTYICTQMKMNIKTHTHTHTYMSGNTGDLRGNYSLRRRRHQRCVCGRVCAPKRVRGSQLSDDMLATYILVSTAGYIIIYIYIYIYIYIGSREHCGHAHAHE